MLSPMSDWLLDTLVEACTAHGIAARRDGASVLAQDGLTIGARVFETNQAEGSIQVQVDFDITSPRLNGIPCLDSFAGLGADVLEAQKNALGKFLSGSFHVVAEALTDHRCDSDQVDWEDWAGAAAAWRVCSGPLLMVSTREGGRIDGYPEFYEELAARFRAGFGAGPHWMRVFLGSYDGRHVGSEVLVDGGPWGEGQALLEAHGWNVPGGYASLRHLLIALPETD